MFIASLLDSRLNDQREVYRQEFVTLIIKLMFNDRS